jgi:hypothetical protein
VPSRVDKLRKQKKSNPFHPALNLWLAPEKSAVVKCKHKLKIVRSNRARTDAHLFWPRAIAVISFTNRERMKKLSLQFKLSNGNDIFLTLFGIRTQDAFCSLRYALNSGQKPFEFVIFYTGRQSHLCLSACAFFLKSATELPPRQGTEAAGSSNATANTRTATLYYYTKF